MLKKYITVRTQYEGCHQWENAPDEVAFLKHPHRHLFKVSATLEVFHDDRELEFFLVQREMQKIIAEVIDVDNAKSCEHQATMIAGGLQQSYGWDRCLKVSVSEDGENDGVVEWNPDN